MHFRMHKNQILYLMIIQFMAQI